MSAAPVQVQTAVGASPGAPADATSSTVAAEHGIVTPEAVVLDIEPAGYASRVLAALIDLTIQLTVLFFAASFLAVAFSSDESGTVTALAIVTFLVLFGYPIVLETWLRGRTPGKMALSLRAVTVDGAPIRLREATLRAFGGVVDRLLPPGGITGTLFVMLTPRHQRVGDLIAGTMVIRDPQKFVYTPALWFSPPPGLEGYAETIDPTAITVEQYTVIRSFLTRGTVLSAPIRAEIARDLANRLALRIRHRPPQYVAPEVFLICAMARYQRRNGPGRAAEFAMASPPGAGFPGAPGPGR